MVYYNQPAEAINQIPGFSDIITQYIGNKNNGTVVDVGAHDGWKWSNSWPLINAGWRGLLIEPHPDFVCQIKKLYEGRTDVEIEQQAVSNYTGKTTLFDGAALSTIKPEIIDGFEKVSWSRRTMTGKTIEVDVNTLNNILEKSNVKPGFDVFSLDVEGSEEEALEDFDIDKWQPKMVIVETLQVRNEKERALLDCMSGNFYKYCDDLFDKHGYDKVFVDCINTIYIRRKPNAAPRSLPPVTGQASDSQGRRQA